MILSIMILLISVYLFYIRLKSRNIKIEEETQKVSVFLKKFLMLSPLIGIVIFTILFSTLLKGQIILKSSHAMIVLSLWIHGTAFYVKILEHYKRKGILIAR